MNLLVGDADGDPVTLTALSSDPNFVSPTFDVTFAGTGEDRTVTIDPRIEFAPRSATITVSVDGGTDHVAITTVVGVVTGATITGTSGPDLLIGLEGIDLFHAGKGHDLLCGNAQADEMRGGGGDDTIRGGNGRDQLFGDAGDDALLGQGDNDTMTGGFGSDRFEGGSGTDVTTDFSAGEGDTQSGVP